ncbi:MAG TPA: glycerol-3-phosphate acyltransferase [Coriobacteriia bacterium]
MGAIGLSTPLLSLVAGYLIGSIPFAYLIVRVVTGEDITTHGTGNVGSMNVRRTTGSWGWFLLAMFCDGFKGLIPVAAVKALSGLPVIVPFGVSLGGGLSLVALTVPAMVLGAVLGHNYSLWMAVIHRRFARTGKGLATGAGALLAYDWRYFVAVVTIGLLTIAITRYMMAGQVTAAFTLPAVALALRSPDWPFALFMGLLVYAAHHKRFVGLLRGREPKLYFEDRMGPRG